MAKVDYTKNNIDHCLCGKCPVQINSKCAHDMYNNIKDIQSLLNRNKFRAFIAQVEEQHVTICRLYRIAFVPDVLCGRTIHSLQTTTVHVEALHRQGESL